MRTRDGYYDFLRGIAILMVIGIHTFKPGYSVVFVRQIIQCAVPLFLAISGYFTAKKNFSTAGSYSAFLKRQLPRVYIPMLIWSIPWMLFDIHNGKSIITTVISAMAGGMTVFYFVPLIMQYYALTPAIQLLSRRSWGGGYFAVAVSLLGITYFVVAQHIYCLGLPMVLSGSPFPVWFIFFYLGVSFAKGKYLNVNMLIIVICIVIAVALEFMEIWFLKPYGHVVYGLKFSAQLYSTFAVLLLFNAKVKERYSYFESRKAIEMIKYIGRISFVIYLSHTLYILLLDHFIAIDNWFIKFVVITIVSVIVAFVLKRVVPEGKLRYIGF